MSTPSKVVAQTDRQTDTHTHTDTQTHRETHRHDENITSTACAGGKNCFIFFLLGLLFYGTLIFGILMT